VVLPNLCGSWVVLSILCGGLGDFIYSVWGSGWFYLFCVGVWVVLSILCGILGGLIYSVWGSGLFYLFCVGPV
jgi:uncharacterized ion transporter superfamily protein YfcC